MPIIAFHGKIGAGKDESAKQIKLLLEKGALFECKAFAHNIKVMTAALCNTEISTQYSTEGKNKMVPVYDCSKLEILLNLKALAHEMRKFKFFAQSDNLLDGLIDIFYDICNYHGLGYVGILRLSIGTIQQEIGTRLRDLLKAVRDHYDENIWITLLFEDWRTNSCWIITDLRFPNEKKAIKNFGGKCVKLFGDPKKVRANSKRDLNHISETALDDDKDWDKVIDNRVDDIEILRTELRVFVEQNMEYFAK